MRSRAWKSAESPFEGEAYVEIDTPPELLAARRRDASTLEFSGEAECASPTGFDGRAAKEIVNLIRQKFVMHTTLSVDEASRALERELGRIPVSENQRAENGNIAIAGHGWITGGPSIRARVEQAVEGTVLRGEFVHPEPLYFLLAGVPFATAPLFLDAAADWSVLGLVAVDALFVMLQVREGRSLFRAFALVAEAALGEDERNEGTERSGPGAS